MNKYVVITSTTQRIHRTDNNRLYDDGAGGGNNKAVVKS
jgi:hypothetical protein